jgi:hypothetical protein
MIARDATLAKGMNYDSDRRSSCRSSTVSPAKAGTQFAKQAAARTGVTLRARLGPDFRQDDGALVYDLVIHQRWPVTETLGHSPTQNRQSIL